MAGPECEVLAVGHPPRRVAAVAVAVWLVGAMAFMASASITAARLVDWRL